MTDLQVPILDPQIHIHQGYAPYDQGIAQSIFIKDMTGQPYNGQARHHGPSCDWTHVLHALWRSNVGGYVARIEERQNYIHALNAVQLWAGAVNFPDFFAQQTINWWTSQIRSIHSQLPLDGLWIDMHEPSNFCTGDVCLLPGADQAGH